MIKGIINLSSIGTSNKCMILVDQLAGLLPNKLYRIAQVVGISNILSFILGFLLGTYGFKPDPETDCCLKLVDRSNYNLTDCGAITNLYFIIYSTNISLFISNVKFNKLINCLFSHKHLI
ncbi:hypothetical protein ACJX0J_031960, partial [Zea mays]